MPSESRPREDVVLKTTISYAMGKNKRKSKKSDRGVAGGPTSVSRLNINKQYIQNEGSEVKLQVSKTGFARPNSNLMVRALPHDIRY